MMCYDTEIKLSAVAPVLFSSLTGELLVHCENDAPIDNTGGCIVFNH